MIKSLHASFDTNKNRLTYEGDGFCPNFCDDGDFWRLQLDYCDSQKEKELGVYSHSQIPSDISVTNGIITVAYDKVIAENGETFQIGLVFTIREMERELDFSARISNNSCVRINELQYPMTEVTKISDELQNDILYAPAGLGLRAKNPLGIAQAAHSEYMSADFKNSWKSYPYPGPLSMPFMGVQSGDYYLCMTRRAKDACHLSLFSIGTGSRNEKTPRFIMSISSFPGAINGETIELSSYRISLSDKDWRDAADSYRKWSNETWLAPRVDESGKLISKESIRHMHGWQRIIFKHQTGEIYHKYSELPRIYAEGAKRGIHHIMLFGWEKECFNTREPDATPDEALGGEEALKDAIRQVNEAGGTVVLYADGMLISTTSDYYKNGGYKCTKKNMNLTEYRREYRFGNNGNVLRW